MRYTLADGGMEAHGGGTTAASRLALMTTPMACDLFMIDSFVLTAVKRVISLAESGRKCQIFL